MLLWRMNTRNPRHNMTVLPINVDVETTKQLPAVTKRVFLTLGYAYLDASQPCTHLTLSRKCMVQKCIVVLQQSRTAAYGPPYGKTRKAWPCGTYIHMRMCTYMLLLVVQGSDHGNRGQWSCGSWTQRKG
jgi:hypothetical protein